MRAIKTHVQIRKIRKPLSSTFNEMRIKAIGIINITNTITAWRIKADGSINWKLYCNAANNDITVMI